MKLQVSNETKQRLHEQGVCLITDITFEIVGELIEWILTNRPKQKNFTLLINSSGGTTTAPLYFSSFVNTLQKEVKIEGVAFGECGSAALALLQCCTKRIAVRHSGFFIHRINMWPTFSCRTSDLEWMKKKIDHTRELEDELIRLQCNRTGLTRKQWMKLADEGEEQPGKAIFPTRARKLGLVDKVVRSYPVF